MHGARLWSLVALPVALLVTLGVACGDDGGDGGEGDAGDAASETADTVCTLLRQWDNELGDSLNATSQAITDADDPDTANDVLLAGYDEMIELAEAHRAELDDLELPDVPDRDTLIEELTTGADESLAVLERERDEATELPPIDLDRQAEALGGAFVATERAMSVLEPEVVAYDDVELRTAFAEAEGCRHVIQPFDPDG